MRTLPYLAILLILTIWSCKSESDTEGEGLTTIEMVTDHGTITLALYNETPLHRDNFVKLAEEGAYDSLLFHRVIETFMIQGGDPDSKYAEPSKSLGGGGLDYRVDAEFVPTLFHKKGALAAARDGNLERASSSMQFYIVQGKIENDSTLDVAETRINQWLGEHYFKNEASNKPLLDSLQAAIKARDRSKYLFYDDSIKRMSKEFVDFEKYIIPDEHREVYKSIGGTPFLDQNYTVFGEVIEGLAVVDSIAAVQTGPNNRPVMDVRILSVRVLD